MSEIYMILLLKTSFFGPQHPELLFLMQVLKTLTRHNN